MTHPPALRSYRMGDATVSARLHLPADALEQADYLLAGIRVEPPANEPPRLVCGPAEPPATGYHLFDAHKLEAEHPDAYNMVPGISRKVTRRLRLSPTGCVYFHSSAVAFGDTLVWLSGSLEAGKSTTVLRLLLQGGFTYVADDILAWHRAHNALVPYPRALCLRTSSAPLFPQLEGRGYVYPKQELWYLRPELELQLGEPQAHYHRGVFVRLNWVGRQRPTVVTELNSEAVADLLDRRLWDDMPGFERETAQRAIATVSQWPAIDVEFSDGADAITHIQQLVAAQ